MERPVDPADLLAHASWMRGLARSLVLDEAQADDVVQDAFVAVAEDAPQKPKSLAGWLRGLVRNLAREGRRTEARRRRREERAARPERYSTTPADLLERTELERRVVDLVLALDEPYRGTILLRYFEDLSAAEIAARQRIPVATVRTRLQRGLDRLRARLDRQHGGNRSAWSAILVPWTAGTAGTAIGTASSGEVAAAAAPGAAAAGSAAASATGAASTFTAGTTNAWILGGLIVSQKSIIAIAAVGVVTMGLGVGLGRLSSRTSVEDAKAQYQLVEADQLADRDGLLKKTQAELDRVRAERTKLADETTALNARVEKLDQELRQAREQAAQTQAAAPAGKDLALAFGEHASIAGLKEADWPEIAAAVKSMHSLMGDLLGQLEKGETIDAELQKKLVEENGKLVKLAGIVMGKIPTHAIANGEFSHPLILSNMMSAVLDDSGIPLTANQKAQVNRLGGQYDADYTRLQQSYTDQTPMIEKGVDELNLKQECMLKMRENLSPQQREELFPPQIADVVQFDVLSPGVSALLMANPQEFRSAEDARKKLEERMVKKLALDAAMAQAAGPALDAWLEEVRPLLDAEHAKSKMPKVEDAVVAGKAQAALFKKLLQIPGLSEKAQAEIINERGWVVPRPKAAE